MFYSAGDQSIEVSDPEMENSTLQLHDSFGFDCAGRWCNLAALADGTLAYVSGRLLHVLDVNSGRLVLHFCSPTARGIGALASNSVESKLAVGEKGSRPSIFIYCLPNFTVGCELRGGTERAYVSLDFSPDGALLCSQGAEPDLTMAVWDWRRCSLLLTFKPSEHLVYRASFSRLHTDHIVTCGRDHIGFWRTARTFTGAKVSGEIGRFGTTPSTDVLSFECLPGGKVASGCAWGNILVWSDGCIERELTTRRKGVPCHKAPVIAFHSHHPWLVSIGGDGWVRLWSMEGGNQSTCDMMSRQEAAHYFRLARGRCRPTAKVDVPNTAPGQEAWLLQDGGGSVWLAEVGAALRGEARTARSRRLLLAHTAPIVALAASPHDARLASLGQDGRLLVRDCARGAEGARNDVAVRECRMSGSALLWLPLQLDSSGSRLIAGFEHGVVALYGVEHGRVRELQALRPHGVAVTVLVASRELRVLASGARDGSVCVMDVASRPRLVLLTPRCILQAPGPVTTIFWRQQLDEEAVLVACCVGGELAEFAVDPPRAPNRPHAAHARLPPNRAVLLDQLLTPLPNFQVSGGALAGYYSSAGQVHLLVRGCDSACVCALEMDSGTLARHRVLSYPPGASLTSALLPSEGGFAVLGLSCGEVQLTTWSPGETEGSWRLAVHEGAGGSHVTSLALSADRTRLYSGGQDGNEFVFRLGRLPGESPCVPQPSQAVSQDEKLIGLPARNLTLTLEQVYQRKQEKKFKIEVKNKRANILKSIEILEEKYQEYIARCDESSRPTSSEQLNPELEAALSEEISMLRSSVLGEAEEELRQAEEAWNHVHQRFIHPMLADSLRATAFRDKSTFVDSYRLMKLDDNLVQEFNDLSSLMEKENNHTAEAVESEPISLPPEEEEGIYATPEPPPPPPAAPMGSLVLRRMEEHRRQRAAWRQEIADLQAVGSVARAREGGDDAEQIREAERTIGDYKLKCDGAPQPRASLLKTRHEILRAILEVHKLKHEFNLGVFSLRRQRARLVARWHTLTSREPHLATQEPQLLEVLKSAEEEEESRIDLLKLCGGPGSDGHGEENTAEELDSINSVSAMREAVQRHDSAVRAQAAARVQLDVRVCLLELHALSLRQELHVLQESEPQRLQLEGRRQQTVERRDRLAQQLVTVNERIKLLKQQLAGVHKQQRAVERRFHEAAVDSPCYEQLQTIFTASYRPQSRGSGTRSSAESERSGSADTRRSKISLPSGCDPELATLINQLRAERYDRHIKILEESKELELTKKEQEILVKKIRLANKGIVSIVEEIASFESERQRRLDCLEVAVPLRLHQLPGGADVRLSECVLVPRDRLSALKGRAGHLQRDTATLELNLTEDTKQYKCLKVQCQTTNRKILHLKREIEDTMMKRFGKVVDMEALEAEVLGSAEVSGRPRTASTPPIDPTKRPSALKLEAEVSTLSSTLNGLLQEKAEKMQSLATVIKEKNDLSEPKSQRHASCSRCEVSELAATVRRERESLVALREQTAALRHELGLLSCESTSSRDLFPAVPPEPRQGEEGEGDSRRRSSAGSLRAPDIRVEHCEDQQLED